MTNRQSATSRFRFSKWFLSVGAGRDVKLRGPSLSKVVSYGIARNLKYPRLKSLDSTNIIETFMNAEEHRAADAADMMPRWQWAPGNGTNMRQTEPIQATLMREDALPGPTIPSRTQPLFTVPGLTQPFRNQAQNAYFRYQGMNRLSNLVSNNSNVFAVWITVGYFEAEPVAGSVVHLDGFRLGQEIGTDTGEVKRHRGFYIIDRSVPVGFQPGENHNVDRAVLLRRFIE